MCYFCLSTNISNFQLFIIMSSYKAITELIQQFKIFEKECKSTDLQHFAIWLANKLDADVSIPIPSGEEGKNPAMKMNVDSQIGYLLGRIGRFSRLLGKKVMEDLPIQGVEEFGYLTGIRVAGNPSKSELITMSITEMTTGVEIIRRLVQAGLVTETPDPNDKRAKRLKITPLGEEVQIQAMQKMHEIGKTGFGFLTEKEKSQFLNILNKLNRVHTEVFKVHDYKEKSMAQLQELLRENC